MKDETTDKKNKPDPLLMESHISTALENVRDALAAAENLIIDAGESKEDLNRGCGVLACARSKVAQLMESFDVYSQEIGSRTPFHEECEALIQANSAKLFNRDWFRKFYDLEPQAAREWIESSPVQSGARLNNSPDRQKYIDEVIFRVCELPTPALKAVATYLSLPVSEAPKPVRSGRRPGRRMTGRKVHKKRVARTRV